MHLSGRRFPALLATAALYAALCGIATGRTWVIHPDPTQPDNVIASVADQAASGDTLQIEAGTYYEHINAEGKTLTFLGPEGAIATILDGSHPYGSGVGSVLYTGGRNPGVLRVVGLTIQNGQGTANQWGATLGGGVCVDDAWGTSALYVSDCYFLDNAALVDGLGGAIAVSTSNTEQMRNCQFQGNLANHDGTALYAGGVGSIAILNCDIDLTGSRRSGVEVDGCDTLRIDDSNIHLEGTDWRFTMVYASVANLLVHRNQFLNLSQSSEGTMFDQEFNYLNDFLVPTEFEDNILWNKPWRPGDHPYVLNLGAPICDATVRRNTVVGGYVLCQLGGALDFGQNIVVNGRTGVFAPAGGCVCCNDIWPDSLVFEGGGATGDRNIKADPLFCGADDGDFHIAHQSPCAAEHSPSGCGQIGALGEACDETPVEETTWGQIKARFNRPAK